MFLIDLHMIPVQYLSDCKICPLAAPAIEALLPRAQTVINQKVNVAVPGFGLLAIKQAKVDYDLCTDKLNEYLRDGWQILAICPQPNQRRPDYVLDKPTLDHEE